MNFDNDDELLNEEYETVKSSVVDAQIEAMKEYEDNSLSLVKIPVTLILFAANMIAYMLGRNVEKTPVYMSGGLNINYIILNKEYVRLFSYMFIHYNFMHIASNMFALLIIGHYVEKKLGQIKTLIIYAVSGILAGLLSLVMHSFSGNADYYTVGASGAIFALMGSSFILKFRYDGLGLKKLIYGFAYVAFYAYLSRGDNVDNIAHLSGGIIGAAIAFVMVAGKKGSLLDDTFKKTLGIILTVVFCVIGVGGAGIGKELKSIPDERIDFVKAMSYPGHKDRSYGEVLEACKNSSWIVFVSSDDETVIEFSGDVRCDGEDKRLKLQFIMDDKYHTWRLCYWGMDGEPITFEQLVELFD